VPLGLFLATLSPLLWVSALSWVSSIQLGGYLLSLGSRVSSLSPQSKEVGEGDTFWEFRFPFVSPVDPCSTPSYGLIVPAMV
jgi:hypothetical protein